MYAFPENAVLRFSGLEGAGVRECFCLFSCGLGGIGVLLMLQLGGDVKVFAIVASVFSLPGLPSLIPLVCSVFGIMCGWLQHNTLSFLTNACRT